MANKGGSPLRQPDDADARSRRLGRPARPAAQRWRGSQKVDLAQISILELVEQYLAYIAEARALKLEVAADYLVMAAWLAYLKSCLLLPKDPEAGPEPGGDRASSADAAAAARRDARGRRPAARPRPHRARRVPAAAAPEGLRLVRKAALAGARSSTCSPLTAQCARRPRPPCTSSTRAR